MTGIAVNCVTSSFTIGFSVQSLVGSGLVLQLNDGTDLTVSATSPTTFATPLLSGANYAVTVKTQPSSPNQICDVTGGSGVVSSANVTNVVVTCAFGTWTWVGGSQDVQQPGTYGNRGTPSASNIPTARQWATSWTDHSGHFWLFGGNDQGGGGMLNDLWTYDPAAGLWTWVSGSSGFDASSVYGSQNVAAPGNVPGARQQSASWTDAAGNLWLFGGRSYAGSSGNTTEPLFNDLWKFSAATGQWTWVSGDSTPLTAMGVFGTQGVPSATTVPVPVSNASSWMDSSGNFWLFGGYVCGFTQAHLLNDADLNVLWKYDTSTNQWTWVSGSELLSTNNYPNGCGAVSAYGTLGTPATSNGPGGRASTSSWIDTSGNLWFFGGTTFYDINPEETIGGQMNDLWKFTPLQ